MAMTKEEILKLVRNHGGEIKVCMSTMDYMVVSLVKGYRTEPDDGIESIKSLMGTVKTLADGIKASLNEWPSP